MVKGANWIGPTFVSALTKDFTYKGQDMNSNKNRGGHISFYEFSVIILCSTIWRMLNVFTDENKWHHLVSMAFKIHVSLLYVLRYMQSFFFTSYQLLKYACFHSHYSGLVLVDLLLNMLPKFSDFQFEKMLLIYWCCLSFVLIYRVASRHSPDPVGAAME